MNGTGCNLVNLPFKTLGSQYFNNFECSNYLNAWKEKLKREGKLLQANCTVISDVPKDYKSENLYTDKECNDKEKLPQQNCQYEEPPAGSIQPTPDKVGFLANNKNSVGEKIEDIEDIEDKNSNFFYLFQTQEVEQVDATTSRIFLPESKGTSMMSLKDEECSVFITSWRNKLSLDTFSPQQEFLCKETFIEYERDNTDCVDDTVEDFKPLTEYTGSILFSNEECEVYLKQWRDKLKHEHPESIEIIIVEEEKLKKGTIIARDSVKSVSIGGNEDEITETENSLNQSKLSRGIKTNKSYQEQTDEQTREKSKINEVIPKQSVLSQNIISTQKQDSKQLVNTEMLPQVSCDGTADVLHNQFNSGNQQVENEIVFCK